MDPELFIPYPEPVPVPDPTLEKSRTRFWIRIPIQTISSTIFQIKNVVPKRCLSNVRSNIVQSNIQFYTVSVRTFVIPFFSDMDPNRQPEPDTECRTNLVPVPLMQKVPDPDPQDCKEKGRVSCVS